MNDRERYPFPALRHRIAQRAAEGREREREASAWLLAEMTMRGPVGFNPGRRLAKQRVYRLRYPVIEVN
jgi:hypothetical protein